MYTSQMAHWLTMRTHMDATDSSGLELGSELRAWGTEPIGWGRGGRGEEWVST